MIHVIILSKRLRVSKVDQAGYFVHLRTGTCLERSIPPGRGIVGMAHSRRMGVISSALPGLSQWEGPSHIENKEEEEKEWWIEKEMKKY